MSQVTMDQIIIAAEAECRNKGSRTNYCAIFLKLLSWCFTFFILSISFGIAYINQTTERFGGHKITALASAICAFQGIKAFMNFEGRAIALTAAAKNFNNAADELKILSISSHGDIEKERLFNNVKKLIDFGANSNMVDQFGIIAPTVNILGTSISAQVKNFENVPERDIELAAVKITVDAKKAAAKKAVNEEEESEEETEEESDEEKKSSA